MNMALSTIMFSKFMLIFVFLCSEKNVPVTSSGAGGHEVIMCREKERDALLSIKKGLTDADDRLSTWGNEEQHMECCQWWGVTCSNRTGSVIALDLQNGEFGGEISPALLELPQLSFLNLNRNDFQGSKIPEFIGSLQKLEHLNLAYSNFSGDVPSQLGNLTNLRTLNLGHNYYLTSNDLSWLPNLSLLSSLDLSNNNFSGPIPDLKASLSLSELRLSDNKLTELPSFIAQLSSLEILDVSYNSLNGTLTELHLSKLHKLTILDLSFNSLTLNFSPDWLPPFQLSKINLARCNVGPRFPTWLRTQNSFDRLDLYFASISDLVPDWFWDKSQLIGHLNFSHNQIVGSIPDFSSHFINTIDVSFNNFSGPVPSFNSYFFKIQLSNNIFNGSIKSICTVKYDFLEQLDLSFNQISGELPNCWTNMTKLLVLNLADNKFSGHLPQSFGSLHNLQALIFRNNNLTGELPSSLKNCEFLHLIDGGGNKLTGSVPEWIGQLKYLGFLILRQNNFHGNIPLEICSLTIIQVLDLSGNNISGTIPPCFGISFSYMVLQHQDFMNRDIAKSTLNQYVESAVLQWKRQESMYIHVLELLTLIDLSSNKLLGNIPDQVFHLSRLASLNLSQNYLTGSIISEIGQMKMLESLDLSRNNLSGEIPASLAELNFLSLLDLASNNLSGKIPQGGQLHNFPASVYADNKELCGKPLPNCPGDNPPPRPPTANRGNQGAIEEQKDEGFNLIQSLIQEYFLSVILGYIVGLGVIVGPLFIKRTWRNAYFGYLTKIGDCMYDMVTLSLTRLIRYLKSRN